MKITRFEHSCLLVEENGVSVLTDVGSWNETPKVSDLSAILITHEHGDHFDTEKIKEVVSNNPEVQVITHAAVGEKLTDARIAFRVIEPEQPIYIQGFSIESYGTEHAIIYGDHSPCRNTGFLLADRLYIPGDALHDVPSKPVDILALPTGGPWMKVSEAIEYAKKVKPKFVFPIHDGMYTDMYRESASRWFVPALAEEGIEFLNLLPGAAREF